MNIAAPNPLPSSRADRQQETTMDEILASIRRIITEDQAVAAPAEVKDHVTPQADKHFDPVTPMANRTAEDIGSAVERLRRALDPNLNKQTTARPSELSPIAPAPASPSLGQTGFTQPRQSVLDEQEDYTTHTRPGAAPAMPPQAFDRGRGQSQLSFAKARAQRVAEARAQAQPPSEPIAPTAPEQSSALLSSEANASVAASFEALNKTVFTQNQDTMENLARELMQPLLKQWLDDNLPTLVEKLVRAEIERVARGGRG